MKQEIPRQAMTSTFAPYGAKNIQGYRAAEAGKKRSDCPHKRQDSARVTWMAGWWNFHTGKTVSGFGVVG